MEPLLKYAPVMLHLSPATRILSENSEFKLTNIQKRYSGLSLRNRGQEIPPGYYELGPTFFLGKQKENRAKRTTYLVNSLLINCIYPATLHLSINRGCVILSTPETL